MSVSVLDIGLGILILLFFVRGMLRGLINEVAGFVGILLGLFLAGRFYPQLVPQLSNMIASPKTAAGVSYAIIFIATLIVVALCATIVRRFMTLTFTTWLDSLLGAAVGTAKGIFICAIVLALMHRFAPDSPFFDNSVLAEHIHTLAVFARSLLPVFLDAAGAA